MERDSKTSSGKVEISESMAAAFGALKWDEELIAAFLQGLKRSTMEKQYAVIGKDPGSELTDALRAVGAGLENAAEERKKGSCVFTVRRNLPAAGQVYVRGLVAQHTCVEFVEDGGRPSAHPILRSLKDMSDRRCLGFIDPDSRLLEVGPNIVTAVLRSPTAGKYLGLVPRGNASDVERASTAYGALTVMRRAKRFTSKAIEWAAEDALAGDGSLLFRKARLEEVTWQADVLMALDALYDIALEDLVRAMYRCGAGGFVGNAVNCDGIFEAYRAGTEGATGRIGQSEMIWRIDLARDLVYFSYANSSTRPYDHSLSQLMKYYEYDVREINIQGEKYLFQRLPSSNEVVCEFRIDRLAAGARAKSAGRYAFVGSDDRVLVKTSAVDLRFEEGDHRRIRPMQLEVGADMFARLLEARLLKGAGRVDEMIGFIRTNRVGIVHNGVRTSHGGGVSADSVRALAVALESIGAQMEMTAVRDDVYLAETLKRGGWQSASAYKSHTIGPARALWTRLVTSMAKVPLVTFESTGGFIREKDPGIVLEKVASVEQSLCGDYKSARRLLEETRGKVGEDERRALDAWCTFLSSRQCDCQQCSEEVRWEEETEEFYDAATQVDHEEEFVLPEGAVPYYEAAPAVEYKTGIARSAVTEYVAILEKKAAALESTARAHAKRLAGTSGIAKGGLLLANTDKITHYGVRVDNMGRVHSVIAAEPVEPKALGRIYDPVRDVFLDTTVTSDGEVWLDSGAAATCYSNSDMNPWLYPNALMKAKVCLEDPLFGPAYRQYPFLNGIWGSGKTFLAKGWFEAQRATGKAVLFLGSSLEAVKEVRVELFPGEECSREALSTVRTVGSVMENGVSGYYDAVIVDEVVKEHSAVVHILDYLLKPEMMWLCGDFGQMDYVPFVGGVDPKFSSIVSCSRLALLQKGHRVPRDVYAAGLEIYGVDSGIYPCDCPEHQRADESLSEVVIASISQVPLLAEKGKKTLTHGQGTKSAMRGLMAAKGKVETKPREFVCSIVEFQGGTTGEVALVRDTRAVKKGSIYMELRRANVGISRSTGKTTYYTNSVEIDAVRQLIRASRSLVNRRVIDQNEKEAKKDPRDFGKDELTAFINGTLDGGHPALMAGKRFAKKLGFL